MTTRPNPKRNAPSRRRTDRTFPSPKPENDNFRVMTQVA